MDTSRSHPSYSDDFEQDIDSPHNSPRSEEKVEIKVFKSSVGSLTVHPQKVFRTGPPIKNTPPQKKKSSRTLSELSVLTNKTKTPESGRSGGGDGDRNDAIVKAQRRKSISSVKANPSKSSLRVVRPSISKNKALAQEKIDPHDIPASIAPSVSSLSLTRLNLQRNLSGGGAGTAGAIRRVLAHTAIKEKSYASAKYKTYTTPPVYKGGVLSYRQPQPPIRAGLAKGNNVTQRVASAKRMTIMDLKSKVKLLEDEIEKLKKENRFLNHLHHRQDNALRKWEGKDAELPRLLNQHKDEIRSLQEQLRRAQQNSREFSEKMSGRDKKILRLENELEKLRALVHEEHLQDRHTLQEDLDITRMNLAGAEKRIREYMRHVDILEKNHRHQLAAQERKLIKVNTHTYELQQVVANLRLALRNKDRMLNYIQMRSSGRTLIRAFHAERGSDDNVMYGASIMTELNRPYQPPLQKSRSFDFGNSRCTTPYLEDSNRDKFTDYPPENRNSLEDQTKSRKQHDKERDSRKKRNETEPISSNANSPKRSQSLESQLSISSKPRKMEKSEKSRANVTKSVNSPRGRQKEKMDKGGSKIPEKVKDRIKNIKHDVKASKKVDDKRQQNKGVSTSHHNSPRNQGKNEKQRPSPMKESSRKNKKDVKPERNKSKELIYQGSTVGFKYEGPFMQGAKKQESTEVLYTANSDKLSQHSVTESSSSSSQSNSNSQSQTQSSRSSRSEILSNIDILSARIRESCINIAPPEEKLASSRSRTDDEAKAASAQNTPRDDIQQIIKSYTEMSVSKPPAVGPGGDSPNQMPAQSHHLTPMILNTNPVMSISNTEQLNSPSISNFQGYVQPIQIISNDVQDVNSPQSHQSYVTSPRIQQYSLTVPTQPTHFQITQPSQTLPNQQTNYVQIGESSLNQIMTSSTNSPQHSPHLGVGTKQDHQQQNQILDANTIQYSPRLQNYATTYNLVSSEPQPSVLNAFCQETQQSAQQQLQQQSPMRYPLDFQYFTFSGQELQNSHQTNPPNLTLIPTNQMYDSHSQQAPLSSRSSNFGQGNFYSAAATTQQQQLTFPRVGYFNPNTTNENIDQNPNSNKTNQQNSAYNPSYYANLGSWK